MECLQQTRDGLRIVLLTTQAEVEEAVGMFREVAQQEGWQPGHGLEHYARASQYFAVVDGSAIVGALQLVPGRAVSPLPISAVWPELVEAAGPECAHVSVLAMRRLYRARPLLFWLLCVEMWRYCVLHGIERLWIEATPATLRVYQRIGWPLEIAGALREHWGEPCYPCRMSVPALNQSMLKKAERSDTVKQIVELALRGGWTV